MAGNPPVFIGSAAADQGAATASPTITTSVGVAAGDAILVFAYVIAGGPTFTSFTDGAGDTFGSIGTTVNAFLVRLGYCLSSAGLASGSAIAFNLSGAAATYYAISAFKVAGGLAALDVSATNSVTTAGTALAAGTTAATAQNVELAVAMFGAYIASGAVPTFTPGGSNTALTTASATNSDSTVVWSEYLVTAATGAQAPTGSLSANAAYYAGIVAAFTYPVVVDPFPVGYTQPFSTSVNPRLRMHHREFNHRRESGLWTAR